MMCACYTCVRVLCILLLRSCNVYDHVVIIILLSYYTLLSADRHHRVRLGDWRR